MSEVIKVGMADLNVCKAPDVITTLGLGSCIGLVFYDPVSKVGGMVHYMLPDSTKVRNNSNIAKFADTGIDDAGGRYFPQAHTYQRGNVHLYAGSAGGDQQANGNKAEQQRQKQYDQNNDNEGKGHFVLTSR